MLKDATISRRSLRSAEEVKHFSFPAGQFTETLTPLTTETNFEITATPMNDDGELRLTATLRLAVSYE